MTIGQHAAFGFRDGDMTEQVRCPVCGTWETHLTNVEQDGESVDLEFKGECGHRFTIIFRQHKGDTHLCLGVYRHHELEGGCLPGGAG